jgi:dinuclear metal center YbgI/SA1388 family protein
MLVNEIINYLNSVIPPRLQENYDNSGLICGNPMQDTPALLISLDCTEEIVEEALNLGCKLIVCHHPILFKPIKSITGKNYIEKTIIKAIKNDICIFSAHTNLDNISMGVNYKIGQKIGLNNLKILSPKEDLLNKIVVFCPHNAADKVREAMFRAGAGNIGNYSDCSFNLQGEGTFKANNEANPYVGEKNITHKEPEIRIEVICASYNTNYIIQQMLKVHPYEEVAYDIYPLLNNWNTAGSGMIGSFNEPMPEQAFLALLKKQFHIPLIKHTARTNKPIKTVAFCGGAGSFLLKNAIEILIVDIGHYESEQFTPEILADIIKKKFPTFAVHLTKINTNPVQYF